MAEPQKGKGVVIALGILVVILGVSNVYVYTMLQNQINALNAEKTNLQNQVNILNSDKNNLQSQLNSLNISYQNLQSQMNQLQDDRHNYYQWGETQIVQPLQFWDSPRITTDGYRQVSFVITANSTLNVMVIFWVNPPSSNIYMGIWTHSFLANLTDYPIYNTYDVKGIEVSLRITNTSPTESADFIVALYITT